MNEEKKVTENVEPVTTQPVDETTKNTLSPEEIAAQALAIAEIATKEKEVAEKDRDSYKEGMLVKDRQLKVYRDQGLAVEEPEEKITIDTIRQVVAEVVGSKPKDVENVQAKKISELKTMLINRQGLPSNPAGGSNEAPEAKPARWVDEPTVKAQILARGQNPDTVFENWKKSQEA